MSRRQRVEGAEGAGEETLKVKRRRIGLFGGSFDPIHEGHLVIARAAKEALDLDEVHFLPCAQSPLKSHAPEASDEQRLCLIEKALENEEGFLLSRADLDMPTPSWSWRLAESFVLQDSEAEFYWIMGADQWRDLELWGRWEYLASLVTFIVYHRQEPLSPREGVRAVFLEGDYPASSSEIRQHPARAFLKGWISLESLDYMRQEGLYGLSEKNPWGVEMQATLMFIVQKGQVLLIRKKRGIGAGKINGPGGKVESGETPYQAIAREVAEELCVEVLGAQKKAEIFFDFECGSLPSIYCHVFVAESFLGVPQETEEALPLWVGQKEVPYEEMWADDALWLPQVLAGGSLQAQFSFCGEVMQGHRVQLGTCRTTGEEVLECHDGAQERPVL